MSDEEIHDNASKKNTRTGKGGVPKQRRAAHSRNGVRSGATLEISGVEPASDNTTHSLIHPGSLWKRLQCRSRWPRRWWYPLHQQSTRSQTETVKKSYEECVSTVRGTMLVLLSFCLFSIVATLGTPDSALIASEAKIKLPFADADIAFLGFLVGAPFLLIVLTLYLHIFDTRRLELENSFKISPVPALFTLNRPLPNALTNLIFFWLVPIVLGVITWKALARLWWGLPLLVVTILVTVALVWIQIRRRSGDRRFLKNLPLWVVLIGLACAAFFSAWDPGAIRRPLNLSHVDLREKWLAGADLRDADLQSASLVKADLKSADLEGANLATAQLQGADLSFAQLQGALLEGAQLQGADLSFARLQGAILDFAQLQGANLYKAQLQGALLHKAQLQGALLEGAQLQAADLTNANPWLTSFPSDLAGQLPRPVGLADLDLSPPSEEWRTHLKNQLPINITNTELSRVNRILADAPPEWEDEARWRQYLSEAKDPTADELIPFLVGLSCSDQKSYVAKSMALRVGFYSISADAGKRHLAQALAQALLNANCEGAKAARVTIEWMRSLRRSQP